MHNHRHGSTVALLETSTAHRAGKLALAVMQPLRYGPAIPSKSLPELAYYDSCDSEETTRQAADQGCV
jgi:hypothetical protein